MNIPVDTSRGDIEQILRIPSGKGGNFSGKHAGPERKWSEISVIKANGVDFASFGHNDLVTM